MPITVYHMPMSRSNRVVWLLEELGLPYSIKKVTFADMAKDDYKTNVHPLSRVPAVEFEDGGIMWESGAILNYLLETSEDNKGLRPQSSDADYRAYLQWFDFAEATLVQPVGSVMQHSFIKPEDQRIPELVVQASAASKMALRVVEQQLENNEWIAGDRFTAADIMTVYSIGLAQMAQIWTPEEFPNIAAYFERAKARPAYTAMTKA